MRDIRGCSGPWRGIWTQGPVRGTMHRFRLHFSGDLVEGGGEDRDGSFSIEGSYDPAENRLVLLKRYPELDVFYVGAWNGSFVAGISIIGPLVYGDQGRFEIWPEDEESGLLAFDWKEQEELVGS